MRSVRAKQLRRAYRAESAEWDKKRRPLFSFRALKRLWLRLKMKNSTARLAFALRQR
jgi:hypothetical protein